MAHKNLSERQEMKVRSDREMQVYKRNDMIQKGRHELTMQEQKCVLYAISKIKPEDSVFQDYSFELSDFFKVCGLQKESYSELKAILQGLADRSWWATIDDKGTESLVRWFSTLRTNKRSGKVTIKFHEDMMPFLLELTKGGQFYTHYELKYVLAMKSQYSIRLYELLKSYQRNNYEWFFDIDALKKQLNCENYKDFKDFRKRVLEPAVEEINEYSDITIAWEPVTEGRKVVRISFYMIAKKKDALLDAERAIQDELDGQMDIDEVLANAKDSVRFSFFKENMNGGSSDK